MKTVNVWFFDSCVNPDKCKCMSMGKSRNGNDILILNEFNLKLSDERTENLCKKAGQNMSALLRISLYLIRISYLLRISPYLNGKKKKLIYIYIFFFYNKNLHI